MNNDTLKRFQPLLNEETKLVLHVFAMRDQETQQFSAPMCYAHPALAVRAFKTLINDKSQKGGPADYPHHFELWRLGTYEAHNAEYTPDRELICNGQQVQE